MDAFFTAVLACVLGGAIPASRSLGIAGLLFRKPADCPRDFGLCEAFPCFFDGARDGPRADEAVRLPGDDLTFFAEIRFEDLRTERFFTAMADPDRLSRNAELYIGQGAVEVACAIHPNA